MGSLTHYMRKELIFYIKQEYDRGVPLSRIRKSLKEGGHHQNLVKEAMTALKKNDYNLIKALNEPIRSDLDKDLYFNIMNSLIRYAEHQLSSGKSEKEIRKVLNDYGHSEDIIDKALKGANKEIPSLSRTMRRIDIGMLIGILLLILITAGGTNNPLVLIIGAFVPTLLTVIILNVQSFEGGGQSLMWAYAPLFSIIYLILGEMGILNEGYQHFNIAMLNMAISLGYTYVKALRSREFQGYMEDLKDIAATDSDKEADKRDKKKGNAKSHEKTRRSKNEHKK
ncbi:MAG: hypothetical protein ACLFTR_03105 [Candidatus Woesearchaeota archaeon]